MAISIASTPPLNAREAKKFFREINEELKKPQVAFTMPNLSTAERKVLQYALKKKK